tara:strand:- start:5078 stop:5431 length:354 start_codon:yes stop_codon:yes gene_type:complete
MPYNSDDTENQNYTEDEMLEYLINEVSSTEEARAILDEHGFSISQMDSGSEPEEIMGDLEEEVDECFSHSEEDSEEDSEEVIEDLPSPAPMGIPRVNIVELRLNAAKKAVRKDKKGA